MKQSINNIQWVEFNIAQRRKCKHFSLPNRIDKTISPFSSHPRSGGSPNPPEKIWGRCKREPHSSCGNLHAGIH